MEVEKGGGGSVANLSASINSRYKGTTYFGHVLFN